MSTVKISQLAELTSADASDLLLITDSSASESKKIQKSNITQENFTTILKNKLDGIEASATADQTAQEIATAIDEDVTAEATLKSALGLGTAAYTASTDYATAAHNHAGVYEPADATILKNADIGVTVQAYNANLVTYATNGNTAYGWGNHASANYITSTGVTYENLNTNGDVGTGADQVAAGNHNHSGVYEPADATILKDADIGVTIQAYNANLVTYATNGNTAYGWGNHASAGYATYPSQTGNSGKYLTTDGSVTSWATVDALPSQTGNSGKYLTTDGSAASWAVLDTDANTTTKGLYEMANTISSNYSITSGNNALSAGPITIASGVSVTVPTGSTWVIA